MAELTFLMNADPAGATNQFYQLASDFFTAQGATVEAAPAGGQTLEGVFTRLNAIGKEQTVINLVSHASGFSAMECPLNAAAKTAGRVSTNEWDLEEALAKKTLAPPSPTVVTAKTRIVIYGCDVGRSEGFMIKLSTLFGNPKELLAPRMMGVFREESGKVRYRQARTWSVVRKAPLIAVGTHAPTGGWDTFRTTFVNEAKAKFGDLADGAETGGQDHLKTILTGFATPATDKLGPTFFFEEGVFIGPDPPRTALQVVNDLIPRPNGDPVKAKPPSIFFVDDRTLVTTITKDDAYKANTAGTLYRVSIILLCKVVDDEEVLLGEGPGYHEVTTLPARAPATGPKPSGGAGGVGGGGPAPVSELQTVLDELLAAGATQPEVDALLAAIPQGDATELITLDAPDMPEGDDDRVPTFTGPEPA
jgi:hypothetical protein